MLTQPESKATRNGKAVPGMPRLSKCEQRLRVLDLTVELLIARTSIGDYWAEGFQDAANLLGAIPLPTADFAAADRRLQNAIGYCQQEEFGAAAFELRALRGLLQKI
jgi:hypothetical protein